MLILHEIQTRKEMAVNSKTMTYAGLVDYGDQGGQSNELADHGLVFAFEPFADRYLQPVAVFASKGATKRTLLAQLLLQCIVHLEHGGIFVGAVVCDGASTNWVMWKQLGDGHCGLDLWRNVGNTTQAVTDLNGVYSTYAFTDEAKRIIAKHNPGKPLFLFLSYQAVHASSMGGTAEAPQDVVDGFAYIKARNRTMFAGALAVMDRSIGEVLAALQSRGMLADSVVAFVSDNGAAPLKTTYPANAGSNWPLRGVKEGVWEGAVRTPAVFWHTRLRGSSPRPPSQQMMHLVDWAPTFYAAAGTMVVRKAN
ncbi:hypothetical protein HPB49_013977 [Dermacentor silvarum]|uniref:Uncharacterized protein n=1 Tax=Dermacentor silvarum TaxID=543639 RepID=A0ACB8CFF1_DERSI|nr:hypothetical protein HPB49_013977 [Dermacentor silvarum]